MREIDGEGLDAILVTASGCGTTIKDYGFMLRTDPAYAEKAARVSALALDISEYLGELELPRGRDRAGADRRLSLGLLAAARPEDRCASRRTLLSKPASWSKMSPEGHLCCGSAGTYNILQPELAARLRDRKVANIERVKPDVIAAGNIGCITQIGGNRHPGGAYGRTARLGDRRAGAGGGEEREALKRLRPAAKSVRLNQCINGEGYGEEAQGCEEGA